MRKRRSGKFRHRTKMPHGKSRRVFKKTARRVHGANAPRFVMRGGVRM